MVPAHPTELRWTTVCYARSPQGVLFIHRCDDIPRLVWRAVDYDNHHGEDFFMDNVPLHGWDTRVIEERLQRPHPILFTSEELQMHDALRYCMGVA